MAKAIALAGKFVAYTSAAGAAGFGSFLLFTRKSQFVAPTEPIISSSHFKKYNPNQNAPALHDLCTRRVPLKQIKPELLQEEGKLVEGFFAGVWSGFGYGVQRRYLERKYRSEETATQLWDPAELANSTYPIGTVVTDHFEVVSRTPSSIAARCGDSPRNSGVRAVDGVFELTAVLNEAEGVAEFGITSFFFQGLGTSDAKMPPPIAYLHRLYTKLLMDSAVRKLLR
ncbi:hypothetical protein B0H15DRAFT_953951 [Mycena belliarum]|uniref:Uncharacterized protein n=1 Tax=Mycena belliarum TaxID=1033014 RepID=A0AAD6TW75_9AGAR|nr:hypothetical protein B0H15DRAFT_953951 [Mycena belliae]